MPYSGVMRCNLLDNGTISALYGDRCYTDYDVATWGQCMTHIPSFCTYTDTTVANKVAYWVGQPEDTIQLQNSTNYTLTLEDLNPAFKAKGAVKDRVFMSSYQGYNNNGLLESVAGFRPSHDSMQNARTHAQAHGAGWSLVTIQTLSAIQFLYVTMLANMDSVSAVGQGITNMAFSTTVEKAAITGLTASLGNATGQSAAFLNADGGQSQSVSFMGMENLWGDCYRFIEGIIIGVGANYAIYITPDNAPPAGGYSFTNPTGYDLTGITPYVGSVFVIQTFDYSQPNWKWTFIPATASGWDITSNTTDYTEGCPTGAHIMMQGESWNSLGGQGIWGNSMTNTYSYADVRHAGRLQYVPQ